MGTLQEALQNVISPQVHRPVTKAVACKPTIRPRDVRRAQERERECEQVTASLENFIDGVLAPLTKVRKISISKAGDYYKARYEGRATSVFVYEPKNAKKNLRFFGEE